MGMSETDFFERPGKRLTPCITLPTEIFYSTCETVSFTCSFHSKPVYRVSLMATSTGGSFWFWGTYVDDTLGIAPLMNLAWSIPWYSAEQHNTTPVSGIYDNKRDRVKLEPCESCGRISPILKIASVSSLSSIGFPNMGWCLLTQAAVVAWVFTSRTRPVKVDLADTTNIVFWQVPAPCGHWIPLLDGDFHDASAQYL